MTNMVPQVRLSNEGPRVSSLVWGLMRLLEWGLTRGELRARIDACLALGITTFDHADIYGGGECERMFGRILADDPGLRQRIQLVTKCGVRVGDGATEIKTYDTSRRYIMESVEGSLRRLKTDCVDILLIHRPDPLMNVDETAAALSELRCAGKIAYAGVSNFKRDQFELLSSRLDFPLVTNQVEASVLELDAFRDGTLDMCQRYRIRPMAWGPLAGGGLFCDETAMSRRVRKALVCAAAEVGNYSLQDMAVAWLLCHPAGLLPVLGTGDPMRLRAAADTFNIRLSRGHWFAIWRAATGVELP